MTEKQKFAFDFNWKLTLSVIFLFPILVSLSVWQLDRAEEKKRLAADWKKQQQASPKPFDPVASESSSDHAKVRMQGTFLVEKFWLKENQFYNGQLGYNVIMPFRSSKGSIAEGTIVAVDRGWVLGSPRREYVPEIQTPANEVEITGTLVIPSDSKLIREAEIRAKTWPHKILEADLPVLSKQSKLKLYPKLLRITPESPGALDVYWKPINISPAKHYGYAVQWGLMAFALLIMYIIASTNIIQLIKGEDSSA